MTHQPKCVIRWEVKPIIFADPQHVKPGSKGMFQLKDGTLLEGIIVRVITREEAEEESPKAVADLELGTPRFLAMVAANPHLDLKREFVVIEYLEYQETQGMVN